MKNKKLILIFILLLFLFLIVVVYIKLKGNTNNINNAVNQAQSVKNTPVVPAEIIKCQNVVVTGGTTVELFTYTSGRKVRADYRVSTTKEETSYTTQIFYDGEFAYLWNPARKYDPTEKVENPPGMKIKETTSGLKIDQTELDKVEEFSGGGISGDRLCKKWDDVDPVFELPKDTQFNESPDTNKQIQESINKVCKICEPVLDQDTKASCMKNLSCLSKS